jgi:hypothetical protein
VTDRITNPKVRAALEKLAPVAQEIWDTHPDLYRPREREINAKQNEVYDRIKRDILPIYEEFYEQHPYRRYFDPIEAVAKEVGEAMRQILKIDTDFEWRGHYYSGERLDVRKAVDMILKHQVGIVTEEDFKLFMRKRTPTRPSHRFVLVLDESGSMKGENQKYALQAVALFQHVLEMIRSDHAIIGFVDTADLHKDFHEKTTTGAERDRLMNELETAGGGGTNDLEGIKLAHDLTGPGKKLIIGIGVGPGTEAVQNVYSNYYQSPDFKNLPKVLLSILSKVYLSGQVSSKDIIIVITDGAGVKQTRDYVRGIEAGDAKAHP